LEIYQETQAWWIRLTRQEFKSESTGLVLAIVLGLVGLCGIGQVYASRIGKGIAICIIGVILIISAFFTLGITAIIYLVIWIWSIFNTRSEIRKWNDFLDSHPDEHRAW